MNDQPGTRGNRSFDVAIIGAGPAGLAAAGSLADFELKTIVIDEQPRAGGQFLRQPPAAWQVDGWLMAPLYSRAKSTLQAVGRRTDIDWMPGTTVLGLQPVTSRGHADTRFDIWLQHEKGHEVIRARTALLASGCYERPLAVPGWTLPGVMGAGAIQAFVKSQQFVPGERFVLAGSHPLQLVVADQLTAAGGRVEAVVFTQRFRRALAAFRYPLGVLHGVPQLMETARIIRRLRRAGVPVLFGRSIAEINGTDGVEHVTIARIDEHGRLDRAHSERIDCDSVGVCHGFLASSEIARQAGAEVHYCPDGGGWLVNHDRWLQSSVPGLFAAGEVTGLAGADASLHKGRIAALGLLRRLQCVTDAGAESRARAFRRSLGRVERFATMLEALSKPPANFAASTVTGDTVICRCELVTHRELLDKLGQHPHIASADAAKLYTRAGMGICQGRFCAEHVIHALAEARQSTVAEVGSFETRFPVKPLNLGLLGSDPHDTD